MTPRAPTLVCLLLTTLAVLTGAHQSQAAGRSEAERLVVEESLRAGFPPSLALAVAEAQSDLAGRRLNPARARADIARLKGLIEQHGGRWDLALARYHSGTGQDGEARQALTGSSRAFVETVLRLQRRYRQDAKAWASALKGTATDWPSLRPDYDRVLRLAALARAGSDPRPARLDDFEPAIEVRRRMVRYSLDDFTARVPKQRR